MAHARTKKPFVMSPRHQTAFGEFVTFAAAQPGRVAWFAVDGPPVPWARAGQSRTGKRYTTERNATAKDKLAVLFKKSAPGHRADEGPYGLAVLAMMPNERKPDADNLAKLVMDGLEGSAWSNDRHVESVHVWRVVAAPEHAKTIIVIWRIEGGSLWTSMRTPPSSPNGTGPPRRWPPCPPPRSPARSSPPSVWPARPPTSGWTASSTVPPSLTTS